MTDRERFIAKIEARGFRHLVWYRWRKGNAGKEVEVYMTLAWTDRRILSDRTISFKKLRIAKLLSMPDSEFNKLFGVPK